MPYSGRFVEAYRRMAGGDTPLLRSRNGLDEWGFFLMLYIFLPSFFLPWCYSSSLLHVFSSVPSSRCYWYTMLVSCFSPPVFYPWGFTFFPIMFISLLRNIFSSSFVPSNYRCSPSHIHCSILSWTLCFFTSFLAVPISFPSFECWTILACIPIFYLHADASSNQWHHPRTFTLYRSHGGWFSMLRNFNNSTLTPLQYSMI